MVKYIVKEISTATENNPNFAGMVHTSLYGKDQEMISLKGSEFEDFDFGEYGIKEYGYDRECDAKRSWIYKNPENTEYWSSIVTIEEVYIDDNEKVILNYTR